MEIDNLTGLDKSDPIEW